MNTPSGGLLALLTGSTVTLTEIIREGSIWLTCAGAMLALLGGFWTYRSARVKFKTDMLNLKMAEIELEKAAGFHNGEPIKRHTRHH
jgi:hypothetical protein